jgi:signal transduction histidine kinase
MNTAGTGLGLSICKQLIEQMAGEVFVESKLNVGTAFILVFTSKKRLINDEQYS